MKIVIPYEPQPRQQLYHQTTNVDELLYGGAAGGGKTEATIWDALYYGLQYPQSRQIIFRRKFPDLERSIIARTLQVYPPELAKYNASKHIWTLANGSIIELAAWDHDDDYLKYAGAEYDVVRWEELTQFKEKWYKLMLSRIRGAKPYPRFVKSTTNPGGEGHAWVKKRFIDIGPPERVHVVQETTDDGDPMYYPADHPKAGQPIVSRRIFIPARVSDNKKLMEVDPDYVARLMSLSDKERKQLLEGDWDTFAGQYFEEWSRPIHVVEPFEIPREWRRYRALDEGYTDPFVCLWIAVDRQGFAYVYREKVQRKLLSREQARLVKEMTEGEQIDYSVGDTSFWNRSKVDTNISPAEVFASEGVPLIPANKERVNGWKRLRDWLHPIEVTDPVTGQKYTTARLRVFSTCIRTIEAIPAMIHDEKNPEDVAEHELDHIPDALRYWAMSRPAPAKPEPPKHPTQEEMIKRHIDKLDRMAKRKKVEYLG
jgi:hypothetical protein